MLQPNLSTMSNSFTTADPPISSTSWILHFGYQSGMIVFVLARDELFFPPTISGGPALEIDFQAPRAEIIGTIALKTVYSKWYYFRLKSPQVNQPVRSPYNVFRISCQHFEAKFRIFFNVIIVSSSSKLQLSLGQTWVTT